MAQIQDAALLLDQPGQRSQLVGAAHTITNSCNGGKLTPTWPPSPQASGRCPTPLLPASCAGEAHVPLLTLRRTATLPGLVFHGYMGAPIQKQFPFFASSGRSAHRASQAPFVVPNKRSNSAPTGSSAAVGACRYRAAVGGDSQYRWRNCSHDPPVRRQIRQRASCQWRPPVKCTQTNDSRPVNPGNCGRRRSTSV